jgi:hypothetical protein
VHGCISKIKQKFPDHTGVSLSQNLKDFLAYQLAIMGWYERRRSAPITQFTDFLPNADEIVGKSWKIKKTIDNSFNGGIIASTQE